MKTLKIKSEKPARYFNGKEQDFANRKLSPVDAMSEKIEHFHLSSIVNLHVGGRRFTTSLQTLTKDPDSMLAAMFSGKLEVTPLEDGAFFIDRDGNTSGLYSTISALGN